MLHKITTHILAKREKGQSLVEVAIFFPIFLIILAGVVEVSHLAITQNRVSNAVRVGAREASQGGSDEDMETALLNSVAQTLETDEELWDLWSIKGQLNDSGTGFDQWSFTHFYGISQTKASATISEAQIQAEVLDELQLGNASGASELEFVGTYAIHDIDSILGLNAIPGLTGFQSAKALNVMRILPLDLDTTGGCTAFPIAVHEGVRSVYPPGQGSGSNTFPSQNDYHNSSPKPTYAQIGGNNISDVPLEDAKAGYLYKIQNGAGAGTFGWLRWNTGISASSGNLGNSLTWPGDAIDYEDHGDGGQAIDPFTHVVRGYINPYDSTDYQINIGDWVTVNTGSVNSNGVRTLINEHIDRDRYLRVLIWGGNPTGQGNNTLFQILGFAVFKLHGHNLTQGNGSSWILAEFYRWDTMCGQVE